MSDKRIRRRRPFVSAIIVFLVSYHLIAICAPQIVIAIFGRRAIEFFTNFWAQFGAWLVLLTASALFSVIEYRMCQKRQRDIDN
jgi:hypothetical protein